MSSRAVIEQAKGIIKARDNCDAEQAFAIFSRISQTRNAKLRDFAEAIVASIHQ